MKEPSDEERIKFLKNDLAPSFVETNIILLSPYFGISANETKKIKRPRFSASKNSKTSYLSRGIKVSMMNLGLEGLEMITFGELTGELLYNHVNPKNFDDEEKLRSSMFDEAGRANIPGLLPLIRDEDIEDNYFLDELDSEELLEKLIELHHDDPTGDTRVSDPYAYTLSLIEQKDPRLPNSCYEWHALSNTRSFFGAISGMISSDGALMDIEKVKKLHEMSKRKIDERSISTLKSDEIVQGWKDSADLLNSVGKHNGISIARALYSRTKKDLVNIIPEITRLDITGINKKLREYTGMSIIYETK